MSEPQTEKMMPVIRQVQGCCDCPFANRSDDGQFDSYCELLWGVDGEKWDDRPDGDPPPVNCPLRKASRLVEVLL